MVAELSGGEPVAISASEGEGLDALTARLADCLPERETSTLTFPNDEDAMRVVSWLYGHATVVDVTYGERVEVAVTARPEIIEQARGRIEG